MKYMFLFTSLWFASALHWENNFTKAKQTATENHRFMLLNFSGSDWCGPCIRMRKEIFESDTFGAFADSALVVVNADFPRQKKNQLGKEQTAQNEQLADTYNKAGSFPYTVLLDAKGNVLKAWTGLPNEDATTFVDEIKKTIDANR